MMKKLKNLRRPATTTRRDSRSHAMIDSLEPRLLLSGNGLLGLSIDVPLLTFSGGGTQNYNASQQVLTVQSPAVSFLPDNSVPPFLAPSFSSDSVFTFSAQIDNNGNLIGGVPGSDMTLTGTVTTPDNTTYTGTLLTGEILDYGYQDNGPSATDDFQYLFHITGGEMASFYSGTDFGVSVSGEPTVSSPVDFSGDFSSDFITVAKGTAGAVPTATTASLGDTVWLDDGNGIQDANENGVANVTVNLYGDLDDNGIIDYSTELVGTTTTADGSGANPAGYYEFTGLTPGVQYQVEFVKPFGYDFTDAYQGDDAAVDSNADMTTGLTGLVTLAPGEHNPTIDAGLVGGGGTQELTASLGDYVWLEKKNCSHGINGIQDADEPGIANVSVELLDVDGNVISTTVTDDTGYYEFTDLAPGTYSTRIAASNFESNGALAGLTATIQHAGTDSTVDSDGDVVTHTTQQITLAADEHNPTLDFGFYKDKSCDWNWNPCDKNYSWCDKPDYNWCGDKPDYNHSGCDWNNSWDNNYCGGKKDNYYCGGKNDYYNNCDSGWNNNYGKCDYSHNYSRDCDYGSKSKYSYCDTSYNSHDYGGYSSSKNNYCSPSYNDHNSYSNKSNNWCSTSSKNSYSNNYSYSSKSNSYCAPSYSNSYSYSSSSHSSGYSSSYSSSSCWR